MMRSAILALAIAAASLPASAQGMPERLNDYPTEVRADYVFGCMATNGQSRKVLSQCSCSIDVIASILPYRKYVEAEAVLSLQQAGGEQMAMFKSAVVPRTMVAELRRAQAEAEILCF
ncbi:lysyl-tRNA synthetase class II [Sinorhizobium fredii]|uniref:Secreted protein n=1 Tax=Sinorhizobium fredii (strain USDA 257) TaxID=1185652 RepID=I3X702_SINF2|nr:hypothetical protein [Sinorhizobium fredii]AFL51658.1 hypothetical protein USDA257_c30900 [Sinorhizobium fredii USDA 257]